MNMENITKENAPVKGWGVDEDPKNDPTYPLKHRTGETRMGYRWERPAQQPVNMEVLHSVERPNISAVFGTAAPPKGLSGSIRRYAFRFSEGSLNHWMSLIVADRINVIEGIVDDLRQGRFPNIFAEKGGKATWKYNRKKIVRKALTAFVVASGITGLLFANRMSRKAWLP